jgi:general secretion pathway protein D
VLATLLLALGLLLGAVNAQAEGEASLNLKDADIRTLIDTVSRVTGRNFVVDPRVKANVTVITSRPMEKEELYQVFLSILEVHGYAAVPVGEVIKIIPDANARQGPVPTVSEGAPGTGDELVTRVLPIRHVPAAQLVPILRPLIPQQGHLAAYPATNVLVISDRAANIERLVTIVQRIDRSDSEEIEVIPLRHASASEVVRIINSLSQGDPQQAQGSPGRPLLAADERSNSILLSGDRPARLRIRGLIAHLDTPLETVGGTQVIFLKYAKAEELVEVLQGTAKFQQQEGGKPAASARQADVDIQADNTTNALIVTAPADIQRNIAAVVRQLDIPRAQVLVEAVIAEVSTDLSRDLGVAWAIDGTESDDKGPVAISNVGGLAETVYGIAQGTAAPPVGMLLGIGDLREGRTNWAMVLRALSGDAATNILSTPTLVTTDNEEAEIVVGQNVPFVTGSYTTTGDTGSISNPFQTIQRQDVGLTLRLTPQVNEGNRIKLAIEQETSSLASSSASAADLITNKRFLRTTVTVEDGDILVLGGLIEDSFRDRQEKVPLLGDIPLLGRLFRYDTTQKIKQNLMVFIHPAIIKDSIEAAAYTSRKYDYLRARQLEAGIGDRGLIKDSRAVFPDLEELVTQLPPPEVLQEKQGTLGDLVAPPRTEP